MLISKAKINEISAHSIRMMKVKYIETSCVSLTQGKEYEVLAIENGWYRIIDDTDEDYLFPPEIFDVIED